MIWFKNLILQQAKISRLDLEKISFEDAKSIAQVISAVENFSDEKPELVSALKEKSKNFNIPIIGITGTGGAGKSSSQTN
jgi:methylmalonyl-CoA mutase